MSHLPTIMNQHKPLQVIWYPLLPWMNHHLTIIHEQKMPTFESNINSSTTSNPWFEHHVMPHHHQPSSSHKHHHRSHVFWLDPPLGRSARNRPPWWPCAFPETRSGYCRNVAAVSEECLLTGLEWLITEELGWLLTIPNQSPTILNHYG